MFNKKSENFKKADYILERGTKSDTTGLSPQLLRKKAELLGKFSFSAIKKAADDQSLGKLFENQKRIKVKVKTTTTKTRTSISRNLLKAKGLIDNAIQQLRKAGLAVNKINEGKDYLKNIRAIINSFLEK